MIHPIEKNICKFLRSAMDFHGSSVVKNLLVNAGSIPGSGRSPGEGNGYPHQYSGLGRKESDMTEQLSLWSSLVAQMVKNLPARQETWVWSLGWEEPLEEDTVTHSSILVWRILMDRGAWWATVHGVKGVRHGWATKHTRIHVTCMGVCVWVNP